MRVKELPKLGEEVVVYYGRQYEDGDIEQWSFTGEVVEIDDETIIVRHEDGTQSSAELYFCRVYPLYLHV